MNATYLKHGRGQSLNALSAKEEGRHPASHIAKWLGKKIIAADIQTALGVGEWHHTGGFANKTPFFDFEECEERISEIIAARDARLSKSKTAAPKIYEVQIVDFYKSGGRLKAHERTYRGEAVIKGDWLVMPTEKIKIGGTRLKSYKEV